MAKTSIGVDVGSRTAVALKGVWKGGTFHVSGVAIGQNAASDLGSGWAALRPGFKLSGARVGISGREVNVRYTRVPEVPDWQLRNLMRFEVQEIGDQSGTEVASDFNLLPRPPEIAGEDVVLLAMARESILDDHLDGLEGAGGSLEAFTPASIALYNAFVRYGVVQDDTVLVANIGHEATDVVLVRGADLLFARNLTGGAGLFDEALMQRLDFDEVRAESVKIDHVDLTPGRRHGSPENEKATRAVMAAAGQLMSLLQSSVMFCKSQVKISGLKLDRVLLTGGGAAIEGLPEYLSAGMGVPVERFDAFHVVDTSALSDADAQLLAEHELESVVALGLATMSSDDEAYSLEILPEAIAKKREFFGGTIWLIAAAVLAVAFLGYKAYHLSGQLGEWETLRARFEGTASRARRVHNATEDLVAQNAALVDKLTELHAFGGSGEQVARTLTLLDEHMPADFWIKRVESTFAVDENLGVERGEEKPILTVRGEAREGTQSATAQFTGFVDALRQALPKAKINPSFNQETFTIDLTLFEPDDTALEGDGDEEDA